MGITCIRLGSNVWPILLIVQGQLLPHFVIEYRSYFTKYHPTACTLAGGIEIGATETCMIMYFFQFYYCLHSDTNASTHNEVDIGKLLGLQTSLVLTHGHIIALATSILSF